MIYLDDYAISLDRRERDSDIDFISHAHSDHTAAAKSSKNVIASHETARLLKAINGVELKMCREQMEGVRLLDSGHMLGSKQIRIEGDGETLTYTGDFMVQRSLSCSPIQMLESDTLIMDSTYCSPEISFDNRSEVEASLQKWTSRKLDSGIVLFGVHAAGKAQEIVKALNGAGITPAVSKKVSAINRVYNDSGANLNYVSAYEEGSDYEAVVRGNFVGVVESHRLDDLAAMLSKANGKRVYRAVATGFAKIFRFNTDVQFPLSDHADFSQSVYYIEASNPKRVLTYGSNSEVFAANLSKMGYSAEPFRSEVGQRYRIMQGSSANLQ